MSLVISLTTFNLIYEQNQACLLPRAYSKVRVPFMEIGFNLLRLYIYNKEERDR